MTLSLVGLAAVAVVAAVLARSRRRAATKPFVKQSASPARPGSRSSTDWFRRDPVLFVGGDGESAD